MYTHDYNIYICIQMVSTISDMWLAVYLSDLWAGL